MPDDLPARQPDDPADYDDGSPLQAWERRRLRKMIQADDHVTWFLVIVRRVLLAAAGVVGLVAAVYTAWKTGDQVTK